MTTFKGYTKEATSQAMMRIDKRERILSIIISGRATGHAMLERAIPTPDGIRRNDMPWLERNLTTLRIQHLASQRDVFEWKVALIQDTGWLAESNETIYEKDGYLIAEWSDTRKLRIFYNWLHKGRQFTIIKVLKYMYSHLFITMFLQDNTLYLDREHDWILNAGFHTKSKDSIQLQLWLKEVLHYESSVRDEDELLIKSATLHADVLPYTKAIHN